MCLCGNGADDNEHFLLRCQRSSNHRTSYLDNVSHLIKRSTTTLSNSLLCDILLFGDNQFNDINNKLILESTVDLCKNLGHSSALLRCLTAIRDFGGNSSFKFTFFLVLTTFLDTSCLLLLSSYPRNLITLPKHSQRHCCDVMGFKPCLNSPIRLSNVSPRDFIFGVEIRGNSGI